MTQLSQTSASIEARAAATYATIDTANGLATRLSTAESNISINATSIESKVSLTDYTGATIASKINQSATSVAIQAAHISLAGKTIALTSDNITIDSTYFKVSKTGAITATSGTIGGFTIDGTSIHTAGTSGSSTTSGAIYLSNSSSGFTRSIGGTSRSNLRFAIGANFAVGATGSLYASDAVIKGTVNATTLISTNAQITGGYFRVETSSGNDNRITLKYGDYSNSMCPWNLKASGPTSSSTVEYDGIRVNANPSVTFQANSSGYFSVNTTAGTGVFTVSAADKVIITAKNAHGNLAGTGRVASNSTSKTVPTSSFTNVVALSIPTAGIWVIMAGARFASNSTGRRWAVLSPSSASSSEDDYGNSFQVPAVDGSYTEGSICKVVTVSTSTQYFYLNAFQNSGQSLTVYATIRAVRIA